MNVNLTTSINNKNPIKKSGKFTDMLAHVKRDRHLLIMLLPGLIFYALFRYGPMYGLIIAFKKYSVYRGILASPWVGFKYFEQFFTSPEFFELFRNTFLLGLYALLWTFPMPIIFALLLNELRSRRYKRIIQTASYFPTFISVVIVASMFTDFLSPTNGIVNNLLASLGFDRVFFLAEPEWFRTIYISATVWQRTGYGAIVYLAALSNINPSLYESADIDGCGRFNAMRYITIPGIMPTVITLLIINSGNIVRVGFEKVLLLYTPMTYEVADVFSTYVYRKGIIEDNFGYATAVGLFESVIALVFIMGTNYLSKKVAEQSIW